MDLRTKPLTDSFVEMEDCADTTVVNYQPGNGSRYTIVVTRITHPKACKVLNFSDSAVVVNVLGMGSMVIATHGYLTYGYVQQKLKCSLSDAIVLAEVIGHLTGREAMSCEEYEAAHSLG